MAGARQDLADFLSGREWQPAWQHGWNRSVRARLHCTHPRQGAERSDPPPPPFRNTGADSLRGAPDCPRSANWPAIGATAHDEVTGSSAPRYPVCTPGHCAPAAVDSGGGASGPLPTCMMLLPMGLLRAPCAQVSTPSHFARSVV